MRTFVKIGKHVGEVIKTDGRLSLIKFSFGQFVLNTLGMENKFFYQDNQLDLF